MFEHDYTINGKHATWLKHMAKDKSKDRSEESKVEIFDRYIDVYMTAVIWGLNYGRMSIRDNSSNDRARIYADAFATERENCMFLYRLTMLLDISTELLPSERLDRAFRDDAEGETDKVKQNLEIFHGYMLGGIEVLYERFADGCLTQDDCVHRVYDLMVAFKDELNHVSYEDKLRSLLKH